MPTPLTWSLIKTTPLSNNNKIDSLLWGVNWLSGNLTYSYPTTGSLWSTSSTTGYGPTTGNREPWSNFFGETSQSDRKFIAQMLQKWTNVANLTFTEVSDTSTIVGDIRFAYSYSENHKDAQAWAYYPESASSSGDIWLNALGSSAKKEFKPGTFEGFTLLHELGHALGLKHPFSASAGVDSILPDSWDSQSFTVMSYSPSTNKEAKSATYFPTTLMLLDIQAIQYLYGTNYNHNAGNNIYLYSDVTDYRETIWDGGGIDSVNYGGTRDAIIDLREGYGSQIGNPIYSLSGTGSKISTLNNIWIAYGVTIENSSGGSGDDKITGNNVDNSLNGGNGNDVMYGGLGNDTFDWDSSKRSGNDTMYGGIGDDVFVLDSTGDSVIEYANEGNNDTIYVDFSYSISSIANIEILIGYGTNTLSLIGNNAANSFKGGKGNDSIDGGVGKDYVFYDDNFADCSITYSGLNYTVKTKTEGVDSITNIEFLKFLDQTIDITKLNSLPVNITGTTLKDTFTSTYINEYIDGGEGIDTVIYSGIRGNYTLTKGESTYTVTDKTGSDGTDTLTNIERLVFSDTKEALGTTAFNESEVQKLYIAYFNRPGDPGGLGYWEGLLANGVSMTMLQNSFSSSAEYQAIYIGQQNTVLITKLYQNLFGRVVDVNDGGVQWWAGEMDAGRHTITTIAGALSSGTTPGSADNIAITNKIAAATAFTNALNTNAETENYVGTAAFAIASNWLAPIRDANILATSLASRDTTIASAVAAKTVLVNATGTANASQGVVTFELAAASFDYTISGFGVGDRIDFAAGAVPSLTNASNSDGQVNLMWSAGGNNVLIKLVGLSGTQDSQLNTLADFNTVFGVGSVY